MPETIPDAAFLEIFDRLCQYVRLGRTRSPGEIQRRMNRILKLMRKGIEVAKKPKTQKRWRGRYVNLRTLYRKKFSERIWREAVENPDSIYGLTLDYGYDRAQRILRARSRKRLGRLRKLRRTGRRRRTKAEREREISRKHRGRA